MMTFNDTSKTFTFGSANNFKAVSDGKCFNRNDITAINTVSIGNKIAKFGNRGQIFKMSGLRLGKTPFFLFAKTKLESSRAVFSHRYDYGVYKNGGGLGRQLARESVEDA
jgi:hypothetical protein